MHKTFTPPLRGLLCAALLALLNAGSAQAHNVWLEPDPQGGYVIQFGGHAGQTEAFAPAKLQSVHAYDRRGREVGVQVRGATQGMRVLPAAGAALIAVHLDNGYFSGKEGGPMANLPMDQNPGATRGVYALKFHKTVLQWGAMMQKPIGQRFEVVPALGRAPHVGEALPVQVLLDGRPLQGASVSFGETGPVVQTDAQGRARITVPHAGVNQLTAIYRQSVQGDAKTTQNSYEFLLGFAVH